MMKSTSDFNAPFLLGTVRFVVFYTQIFDKIINRFSER